MPEMDSPPRMMPWRLRALLGQAALVPRRRSDLLIFEQKNYEEEIFMKIYEFFLIHVQTFVPHVCEQCDLKLPDYYFCDRCNPKVGKEQYPSANAKMAVKSFARRIIIEN